MSWELTKPAQPRMEGIVKAVKGAERLVLATDPDREGEAISWHLLQELQVCEHRAAQCKRAAVAAGLWTAGAVGCLCCCCCMWTGRGQPRACIDRQLLLACAAGSHVLQARKALNGQVPVERITFTEGAQTCRRSDGWSLGCCVQQDPILSAAGQLCLCAARLLLCT